MESVAKDMYKDSLQNGDRIEISPKSLVMMNSFAELIAKIGGGILAIDYGDAFGFSNSLRVDLADKGIANHKYVPNDLILECPGEVDLSAYVNFIALAQAGDVSEARSCQSPSIRPHDADPARLSYWHGHRAPLQRT